MDEKFSSGQVLLLVLLAVATITVIVLSIASRTITEVQVTNVEDESLRAFSAAEAGVETALIENVLIDDTRSGGLTTGGATDPDESNFVAEVLAYPDNSPRYLYPNELLGNESATFWFVPHEDDGSVDTDCSSAPCYSGDELWVCWGEPGTFKNLKTTPAAVLSIVYYTGASFEDARATFDPGTNRDFPNNFTKENYNPGSSCRFDGTDLKWGEQITISDLIGASTPIYAKLQLLYNETNGHSVGFYNPLDNPVPAQGKQIESTGTAGDATRKIEVYSLYSETPDILNYAIYSGEDIK